MNDHRLRARIDATGVIIAGGKSRRFGSNKALADWHGRPLIKKIADDVAALFSHTLLVTNSPDFNFLHWETAADLRPGQGPLAGLEAAIIAADTEYIFLTGCDLPCLSKRLIRHLFARRADFRAIIPTGPRGPEPLCAIYRRDLLDDVRALLDRGELRIAKLAEIETALLISADEVAAIDPDPLIFTNINRTADLYRIQVSE